MEGDTATEASHASLIVVEDLPAMWYKDEGGKQNWLTVTVRVPDGMHLDADVPLACALYVADAADNVKPCEEADIFTVDASSLCLYEGNKHACQVKFRIEHVSRRHNDKPFCVWIAPAAGACGAVPALDGAWTRPVIVCSKRKTDQRRAALAVASLADEGVSLDGSSAGRGGRGGSGSGGCTPAAMEELLTLVKQQQEMAWQQAEAMERMTQEMAKLRHEMATLLANSVPRKPVVVRATPTPIPPRPQPTPPTHRAVLPPSSASVAGIKRRVPEGGFEHEVCI